MEWGGGDDRRALPIEIRRAGLLLLVGFSLMVLPGCNPGAYPVDLYREMHYQVSQRRLEPDRLAAPPGAVPISGGRPSYTFDEATGLQNPVRRTPESIELGRSTFKVNCAMCHGSTGNGKSLVADLFARSNALPPVDLTGQRARSRTDGQLYWLVTNGIGNMPPFGDLLTENERWALVYTIREGLGQ